MNDKNIVYLSLDELVHPYHWDGWSNSNPIKPREGLADFMRKVYFKDNNLISIYYPPMAPGSSFEIWKWLEDHDLSKYVISVCNRIPKDGKEIHFEEFA